MYFQTDNKEDWRDNKDRTVLIIYSADIFK